MNKKQTKISVLRFFSIHGSKKRKKKKKKKKKKNINS